MRVLHVVATTQRRGAETFASDLVGALDGRASQRVAVLRASGAPQVAYRAPVALLEASRWRVPGANVDVRTLRDLRHRIARWRPDVVQAHGAEALKYSMAATMARGTRVVYRCIGTAPRWTTHGPRRLLHAALMRGAARVVAVAEAVRRQAIEVFGLRPERVVTIPNGVDAGRIHERNGRERTREALGIPTHAVVLLSLGALTWEKDPLAQLEVAERALREEPGASHLFVGDGPMRGEVEEGIRRRGLEGRSLVLGAQPGVGDLLAASDLLLFASRSDGMEGMPATVIEAGMAGLAVVAYAVAGVPEVVLDGATGLLAPPGDLDALARNALRLLRDGDARGAMGAAARERCRARFGIDGVAAAYLALYEEVAR